MIRHCVFIRFKSNVTTEHRDTLFEAIVALQSHLAGILAVHLGPNVSPETGMDKGYTDENSLIQPKSILLHRPQRLLQ